jgi:osmotically-inducible protein OsmY
MANNQWQSHSGNNTDWNDSQENLNPNQGFGQNTGNQQRNRYNDQQRGHASFKPDSDYNTGTNYGNTYNQRYENDYNPDNFGRGSGYNAADYTHRNRYESERFNSSFDNTSPYNRQQNRYDPDYDDNRGYGRQYSAASYNRPYRNYERGIGAEGVGFNRDYRHDYDRYTPYHNRREDWRTTDYGYGKYDTNYGYGDNYGNVGYGRSYNRNERNDYRSYNDGDRDWWDRATDEVSSWFGDRDAERRRRMDKQQDTTHRGRGPKGYKRSDERIREDINDRLSDDHYVDASDVDVKVEGGDVILSGTVESRAAKRRAEDIVEAISGVSNVENRIRVRQFDTPSGSSYNSLGTSSPSSNLSNDNSTTDRSTNSKTK